MGVFTVGRQVGLEILMPGWWLSGAAVDMDFRNGRYYDSANPNTVSLATDFLSCTRASTGYAQNSSGTWVSFASNQLRTTDLGLLVENSRTNSLLNSSAPITQTTASLATGDYTLWVEGSGSALASAGSATITGAASATQNNPDTFTVTVAGTVTVTVTGSLTKFQLELGSFPSSFILTTGAAATRASDSINIIGSLATLLAVNASGTAIFDATDQNGNFGFGHMVGESDGGRNIVTTNGDNSMSGSAGYGGYFFTGGALWSTGIKSGQAWTTGAGSLSGHGQAIVTSATPWISFAPNPAHLYLGSRNVDSYMYGYMRRLTAWNTKLADATLQALTVS